MTCRRISSVFLGVIIATITPALANAIGVEFTPVVGHFTPLESQITDNDAPLVVRQSDATAFGARLTVWLAPRIAAEASFVTASGGVTLIGGGQPIGLDGVMIQLDARARFRVNDPNDAAGLDIIAGLGISDINEGLSDVGEDLGFESPSAFTIVVGLGGTLPVSDRIRLRFDIEDHIHDANYEVDEANFGSAVSVDDQQHDIVLLAGIVLPIWE